MGKAEAETARVMDIYNRAPPVRCCSLTEIYYFYISPSSGVNSTPPMERIDVATLESQIAEFANAAIRQLNTIDRGRRARRSNKNRNLASMGMSMARKFDCALASRLIAFGPLTDRK